MQSVEIDDLIISPAGGYTEGRGGVESIISVTECSDDHLLHDKIKNFNLHIFFRYIYIYTYYQK